ncbi:hypothetical protein NUU61_008188 [Penicillium alfredii]|uniref:Uncharacterized protein n=1 Tax=Penicillium alfredii TaxID=1506179 RepID=A0A9W9JZ97_9EURO|nr:uncharacterized protein NUU61_008188 [Penicillium alfredii]KAJ5086881.1 hypothetical protein NUU61_008188 [Penicillium alfredii]
MMVHAWSLFSVVLAYLTVLAATETLEVLQEWDTLATPDNFEIGTEIKGLKRPSDEYNDYKLYRQAIKGKNQRVKWPVEGVLPRPLPKLGHTRPDYDPSRKYRVHYVFPSKKQKEKNFPLRKWAEPQIEELLESSGVDLNMVAYTNTSIDVKNTGVGEQPWKFQMGFRGGWNRTMACSDATTEEFKDTDLNDLPDMIWVLAIESCMTDKEGGYDSPTFLATELYSRYTLAAAGAGPALQGPGMKAKDKTTTETDMVKIASDGIKDAGKKLIGGFLDAAKLMGKSTVGDVYEYLFGLNGKNWHKDVCGHPREDLISSLLDTNHLRIDWKQVFKACARHGATSWCPCV